MVVAIASIIKCVHMYTLLQRRWPLKRRSVTQAIATRLQSLTPRELDVLRLMVEGRANKVIAIDLDISQRTVEIHRARVMEKLEANSLAHLVRMVMAVDPELLKPRAADDA